jgi:sugar-specific transcriptional regulator TrmB
MELQDEVQTLSRLGLTTNQAKVYLALVRSGMSTAKTISKKSNNARPHVYLIMPTLEKLGLVQRIISTPSEFKAISLQDALSVLMTRRTKDTSELQTMTKEILKKFENKNTETALEEEGHQFILIPQKGINIQKRRVAIKNAQKSIDVISSTKRLPVASSFFYEEIMKALQRGVKIRVITEKPEDKKVISEIKEFRNTLNYRIRYSSVISHAKISIYDKKEALMTTLATAGFAESSTLWSNNPSFLAILQNYFENLWVIAIEEDKLAKITN